MAVNKNPVSMLQEICQSQFRRIPDYTFRQVSEQEYTCTINVCDIILHATGVGKKGSKNKAAEAMLVELGLVDAIYDEKAGPPPVSIAPLSSSTASSSTPSSSFCSSCSMNLDSRSAIERTVECKSRNTLSHMGDIPKKIDDRKHFSEIKETDTQVQRSFTSISSLKNCDTPSKVLEYSLKHCDTPSKVLEYSLKHCDTPLKVPNSSLNDNGCTRRDSTSSLRLLASMKVRKLMVASTAEELLTSLPPNNSVSVRGCSEQTSSVQDKEPKRFKSESEGVNVVSSTSKERGDEVDRRDTEGCLKSPVSFLQEEARRLGLGVPRYTLELTDDSSGSRVFYMEVVLDGRSAMGSGPSKREAKANTAISLMSMLSIRYDEPRHVDSKPHDPVDINYVGKLHTYCLNNLVNLSPEYCCIESQGQAHSKVFTMKCTVGTTERTGTGSTKKEAKHASALAVLQALTEKSRTEVCAVMDAPQRKRLDDPADNANAWQEFCRVKGTDRPSFNTDLGNIPVSDYVDLFRNGFYGRSPTLDTLRASPPVSGHREIFRRIMEELSINFKLLRMETTASCVVLNLVLETSPNWSFMQVADTIEDARNKIFKEALDFLLFM